MASYDYRCRVCDAGFTVQRAMSDTATLARCPQGHDDVARVWSAVAITGKASTGKAGTGKAGTGSAAATGGGCCGGGCCAG